MSAEMEMLAQLLNSHRVELEQRDAKIADLEQEVNNHSQWIINFANNQISPSMGDGWSGDYCRGYEAALSDMVGEAKKLTNNKEQGE